MMQNTEVTVECLQRQLLQARSELKNIRLNLTNLRAAHQRDVELILNKLKEPQSPVGLDSVVESNDHGCHGDTKPRHCIDDCWKFRPIGYVRSMFKCKNGTPRQPGVCLEARATLAIGTDIFNNPAHSLHGLQHFSHVWILFVFHKNGVGNFTKAKVKPPRLDGVKVGLFASRCPYRPNPIGLTLAKIDKLEDNTVYLSGIDILDGTPVLDIKPFIPEYDSLGSRQHVGDTTRRLSDTAQPSWSGVESDSLVTDGKSADERTASHLSVPTFGVETRVQTCDELGISEALIPSTVEQAVSTDSVDSVRAEQLAKCDDAELDKRNSDPEKLRQAVAAVASWITSPPIHQISTCFSPRAEEELRQFGKDGSDPNYRLRYLENSEELRSAISEILCADPRSVYRRQRCSDRLYYVVVDSVHVTCWFDGTLAEVLKLQPSCFVQSLDNDRKLTLEN